MAIEFYFEQNKIFTHQN